MNLEYSIPKYAEVISSIGVALAMVRDVVERVIPNPTTQDIVAIKREAKMSAIKSGAVPDSVEVQIEIDAQTSKVTAIALGSTEVKTTDLLKQCTEEESLAIASKSMGLPPDRVFLAAGDDVYRIYGAKQGERQIIRLLDRKGFIKIQRGNARVQKCLARDWEATVEALWKQTLSYRNELVSTPDVYLCVGGKVLDYVGTIGLEQLKVIMATEFMDCESDAEIILISAMNGS